MKKFFTFIPWIVFSSQSGPTGPAMHEHQTLNVGLARSVSAQVCSRIEYRFHVQLARAPADRARGYQFRNTPLRPDEGMLFVFEPNEKPSFWMKNTRVPLQLLFFDSAGKLLQSSAMAVESDPAQPRVTYTASGQSLLAMEVAPNRVVWRSGDEAPLWLCVER